MSAQEEAKRVLKIEADAIMEIRERVDASFDEAVKLVLECRGRVVVIGMGKSGIIGRKIAATLASVGSPALYIHPAEGGHGDIGMIARGDLAIILSRSGETDEVLAILPALKRMGVRMIAVTGVPGSTLAREASVVLDVRVREEACSMDLVPTASTTAALAVGDALAVAVMKERKLTHEDYAQLHPAGTLGRRLLLRLEDIMRKGEEVARVERGTTLRDAILTMTEKKVGATCVTDAGGRLIGILTDHDLRRVLTRPGIDVGKAKVEEVMTASPLTAFQDMLVAEAIRLTETRKVSVLPVVERDQSLIGLVHLHDLLSAGVL